MSARLVYLVEWRQGGAWRFRAFTSEPPALRVASRMADRHECLPIIAAVLPGDMRMLQAGAERVA